MDANRFDSLTRTVGEQTNRRKMFKAAAGSTLAVLGLNAVGRVALGQDVSSAATGFKGDSCDDSGDCRRGLICDQSISNPRCQYKRSCGGKKSDACKNDGHCCNNRNLICDNRKCKRDNNKRNK